MYHQWPEAMCHMWKALLSRLSAKQRLKLLTDDGTVFCTYVNVLANLWYIPFPSFFGSLLSVLQDDFVTQG